MWADTLAVNVTANYLLADEAAKLFEEQGLHGNIVFTSSANAVVAKRGSEAYDVSKAALSHLIRELAVSMAPNVRVNGISPATVVKGSTMFPRDRVRASLTQIQYSFPGIVQRRGAPQPPGRVLRRAHVDAQGDRSGRLRGSHSVPGQSPGALHHGPRDSRGRRFDRSFRALMKTRRIGVAAPCKKLRVLPLI